MNFFWSDVRGKRISRKNRGLDLILGYNYVVKVKLVCRVIWCGVLFGKVKDVVYSVVFVYIYVSVFCRF